MSGTTVLYLAIGSLLITLTIAVFFIRRAGLERLWQNWRNRSD